MAIVCHCLRIDVFWGMGLSNLLILVGLDGALIQQAALALSHSNGDAILAIHALMVHVLTKYLHLFCNVHHVAVSPAVLRAIHSVGRSVDWGGEWDGVAQRP